MSLDLNIRRHGRGNLELSRAVGLACNRVVLGIFGSCMIPSALKLQA